MRWSMEENNKYKHDSLYRYTQSLKLFSFEKFSSNDILTRRNRVKRPYPPTHIWPNKKNMYYMLMD